MIALTLLAFLPSSAQGIRLSERVARLVLQDLALLDKMKADARIDSTTIHDLTIAYYYKDSALTASIKATEEADWKAHDYWALNEVSKKRIERQSKEIRKQRRLKWLFLIGSGVVFILAR